MENKILNNLQRARKEQNKIFYQDCVEDVREQDFLYYLGNHPTLFAEFIEPGFLTTAEMNYIVQHFYDYMVDPRTFGNDFKRAMREALPIYNQMKAEEIKDEIFADVDESFTREIVSNRLNKIVEHGGRTTNGTTNTNGDNKSANRQEPMETTGNNFDETVSWEDGASNISENKNTGSSIINQTDINNLMRDTNDDGNSNEKYNRKGNPIDHINKIWNYLVKPKAINWLTAQLSTSFILIY